MVVGAHGVHGAVKVKLHNPSSTALEQLSELIVARGVEQRRVRFRWLGGDGSGPALLELEGVTDRDAAGALRGAAVLVERSALPPLEDEEYYYHDLIGCEVESEAGGGLGRVAEVFSAGASDVLVVRDGDEERLIPLVDDWVIDVDVPAKRIRVRGSEQFETTKP